MYSLYQEETQINIQRMAILTSINIGICEGQPHNNKFRVSPISNLVILRFKKIRIHQIQQEVKELLEVRSPKQSSLA
jgi:hypothetical protein